MTAFERLHARLVAEGADLPSVDTLTFYRTYAGARQREAGAWSWYATEVQNGVEVEVLAGYVGVTELLRAPKLGVSRNRWSGNPRVLEVDREA